VKELDEQMSAAKASEDAGLRVTYEYSLVWDTLGWIYFQQGDAKRAESLVRAAWLLGEDSLVGEHLGEIYEKEGKIQQAVRSYEFALSVSRYPSFTPAAHVPDSMKQYKAQAEEITARYEKLTGKKPTIGIRRLPNGQWSQTPAEQLRHTREVTVTNDTKISGYGQFIVVLDKGKTESAHYLNGDEVLKPLAIKLAAAHYPLELPSGSEASLTVRVNVSCHAANPCTAELSGATSPGRQFAAPAY
jgi:tetratricopeptide (TPR) repeat protein